MSSLIRWFGEPVSLIGVWLIAGPPYLLLWWWTRAPTSKPATGLLAWVRDTSPAVELAEDDEQDEEQDEPQPDDDTDTDVIHAVTALPAVPQPATIARTFRLGDDEVTFRFRDIA